ncbi:MAG: nucleoside phosphorylase [Ruminococcus sp.]|jgi:Uridine phosphorylase|nr:nucleoside phosphorylase [Ruminococcus sp.]
MITDSFDLDSRAIIDPFDLRGENLPKVDICIITFSRVIEKFVTENFPCEQIAVLKNATGDIPVYAFDHEGRRIGFFKSYEGSPAAVGAIEDCIMVMDCEKFLAFGGAGCLDKEIAHGKVMVPDEAYRDEGTSYHYAAPADYIKVKNAGRVAKFMEENGLPYVVGKTWTTDAFFRETRNNFNKRKAEGCISVEMECSGFQAVCDFRGLEFYTFFTSGDLLDAPKWDERKKNDQSKGTQHDTGHFDIALELAVYVAQH